MKAWMFCPQMTWWLAGCVGGRGWVVLILGRAGRGRGVSSSSSSPGPVLTGGELQLGGHGGRDLGVVWLHGLGKVLGARVETWKQRKSNQNTLGNWALQVRLLPVSSAYQSTLYTFPSGP